MFWRLFIIIVTVLNLAQAKLSKPAKTPEKTVPPRIVLIAYEVSETLDLLRMRRQLLAKFPGARVTFISFGPCSDVVIQENPQPLISLCNILPVEIYDLQDDPEISRAIKYPHSLVQNIVSKAPADFIITGMSSRIQQQLAKQYKMTGARVITYYDSFAKPIHEDGKTIKYIRPFMKFVSYIDTILVTSNVLQTAFRAHKSAQHATIYVVGKPSLDKWREHYVEVWSGKLRNKYNITAKKVVLFAGDNSKTYKDAFQVFVNAAKQLPSVQFVVTYLANAATKGDFERRIIESHGAENIQVVPYSEDITIDLSKIADVMIMHKSSEGPAALSVGLPVIYIANEAYSNFAIEQGLADRVYDEEAMLRIIRAKILNGRSRSSRIAKQVPQNGFQNFLNQYEGFKQLLTKPEAANLDKDKDKVNQKQGDYNGTNTVKHDATGNKGT